MIEVVGAALLVPVHALAVELERLVAGVDGYTARALSSDGSLQGFFVARLNINKASIPTSLVQLVVSALVVLLLVRVELLRVDASVVLDVLERKVHEPTAASLVAILPATVNQVLL